METRRPSGTSASVKSRDTVVVGLDLAGSPHRTTGFCVLDHRLEARTLAVHSDSEIIRRTVEAEPVLVSIDAPLSLPRGRRTIDDRNGPHFRQCDLELRRRGIRFFPVTLGPMRMLTSRGIRLRQEFERRGLPVAESYPGAAQDILGIARKAHGVEALRRALARQGLRGLAPRRGLGHDELDAVTSALVGVLWLLGRGEFIGDPTEGLMLLPLRGAMEQLRSGGGRGAPTTRSKRGR